ncbi:MAG: hypothetical protein JW891_08685 [Candidatus Lokiarchaeota archaeon]|nr:hypothetical protein [Candidatus Lokiarchaeota archaeon]
MKITISIDNKAKTRTEDSSSFSFELTGKGTNEEPHVMLDNYILVFSNLVILISDSKEHLLVEDIHTKRIKLENCENVALKHSQIKSLELKKS